MLGFSIAHFASQFTYAAIFGLLVAAGVGVPFPEDLTLLTAGYLAKSGHAVLWLSIVVGYVGVLVGDWLIFRIGKHLGTKVFEDRRFKRLFTARRQAWLGRHFSRHGVLTVVVGRHAPGLRAPTFLAAGASGMRDRTFLLADGAAALLTVPLVVGLGYVFAARIDWVRERLHGAELVVGGAAVLAAVGVFALRRLRDARAGRARVNGRALGDTHAP